MRDNTSDNINKPVHADPILAAHANAIRALGKRVIADVIEIGQRLTECRRIKKEDGEWRAWLDDELRWSPQTAGRFIQLHQLSLTHSNLEHLELPVSGLYALAAPSTPEAARDAVLERAATGEKLTTAQITETIDTAKRKPAAVTAAANRAEQRSRTAAPSGASAATARKRTGAHAPVAKQPTEKARAPTAGEAVGRLRDQIDAAVACAIGVSPMQPIIDAIFDIAASLAEHNGDVKLFVQHVRQRVSAMDRDVDQPPRAACAPPLRASPDEDGGIPAFLRRAP
jgi:hypothetical protein